MRSISTLQWEAGQAGVNLKNLSLDNTILVKSGKLALKVLLFLPYHFNSYLDSLDEVQNPYRKNVRDSHTTEQDDKHRHIPSRVWQRRSALITALEEHHHAMAEPVEATVNVAPLCQVASDPEKKACTSCSFNVIQVRCLPVWASNFSDIGMIEQELDYFSQQELIRQAV